MENKLENFNKILTNIIRIIIIVLAIFTIFTENYENLGILVITFLLTFYDKVLKLLKINLSIKTNIALILFIFGAQVLGTVLDFYGKFHWWDTMLHFLSGVIFFFIGETLIYQLNKNAKNPINNISVIMFSICFALSTGVVWEIFEFSVDTFLGQNIQVTSGLVGQQAIIDTMVDLISVTLSSTIIGIIQIVGKKKKNLLFD